MAADRNEIRRRKIELFADLASVEIQLPALWKRVWKKLPKNFRQKFFGGTKARIFDHETGDA
jgi:transposase